MGDVVLQALLPGFASLKGDDHCRSIAKGKLNHSSRPLLSLSVLSMWPHSRGITGDLSEH